MNEMAFREYRQDFALAILRRRGHSMTAGDVAEHLMALAQAEGHPDECWRGADPVAMAGHLRALEGRSLVKKVGERKEGRSGRSVPLWALSTVVAADPAAALPFPPTDDEEPAAAQAAKTPAPTPEPQDNSPYAALTRPQLYALLDVHDDIASLCVRFLRDIQDVQQRSRRVLSNVGLESQA